ncbi:hypothetical protein [Peribacillus deserti]|uniref:Uncharacterized protein n=1 Tax=Peribacillus deserti TaxID=673318 RepID=A0A2N5M267_9BACI|nr:hypothetical protein [Peribacillus deserti]PLT28441.1 hypothetical protein CUU66_18540 [Peribacillus deserti]
MDNFDSLIRRYLNLHDNAFYLASQLSEVNKVLADIEETLKKSLHGKRFTDTEGRRGVIRTGSDYGRTESEEDFKASVTQSENKIHLVYDDGKISYVSLSTLRNLNLE